MNEDMDRDLLHRYVTGECTPEEHRAVEYWIQASPDNKQTVETLRKIWDVPPQKEVEADLDSAWDQLENKIQKNEHPVAAKDPSSSQYQFTHKTHYGSLFIRIAAVILIGFFLSLFLIEYDYNSTTPPEQATEMTMREVVTKRAHQAQLSFSDGTRVVLNAESKIRFPEQFHPGVREVYLEGEAYFEVAHKEGSAFVVQTRDARVKVLGTKFNVKARAEDEGVEVAVAEGRVSFQSKTDDEPVQDSAVVLTKGQMSHIVHGLAPSKPKQIEIRDYLTWLRGDFVFKEVPFKNVLTEWERRFDVEFAVRDSSLLAVPFTGEFRNESLNEILKLTSESLDFNYQRNASVITIEAN